MVYLSYITHKERYTLSYLISELAELVGLSRTTLLYYEKQKLIASKRQANGYRIYSDKDLQILRLLKQLQAGGLTLKECQSCLEAKIDQVMLKNRLQQLDAQIVQKQKARELLEALTGLGSMRQWHILANQLAPDAHFDWLKQQGFDEKHAFYLKWLSKDMNEHDQYMADFMQVYHSLDRWGPGTKEDSLRALTLLPSMPKKVLDIGCGKGLSTTLLAEHTEANIIALDNEPTALKQLENRLIEQGFKDRVSTQCASMTELPYSPESFDLIWAEGSAYIMGVENALKQWKTLLQPQGCLVLSDLVWLTESPSQASVDFWQQEYPDMQTVAKRIEQMRLSGFEVLAHFTLSDQAWLDYYLPVNQRVNELKKTLPNSTALQDLAREVAFYKTHLGEFGYEMFVLKVC